MIDQKTVAHLADLARMKIGPEETARLEKELGSILDYVGALQKVDTKGISKEGSVGLLRNVWRTDIPGGEGDREAILDEAPMREGDYVAVKKVIEYER
jgi:aspartyl-tRNA(Asn)/glutamyl-tRNA(Gln) amidotransferase subunit C